MTLQLKRAQRHTAFLKLGISAPSGGGKTMGSLLIAYGLLKEKYPNLSDAEIWAKIAIVDTENGSGELYVGSEMSGLKIGTYNAVTITPPFEVDKYIQAMDLCKEAGMEVCILDSTTHAWSGEGGLLEQQGAAAKRSGNSYTAWRDITPQHNAFVNKMLQIPMHIIATTRAKQEYVQEKADNGKNSVRKLGMEPEQRKGMEYEFTTFFDIDSEHGAFGSKDRTSIFDQKAFKITPDTGRKLMRWLETSVDTAGEVVAEKAEAVDALVDAKVLKDKIIFMCSQLGGSKNANMIAVLKKYTPNANPNSITDPGALKKLLGELDAMYKIEFAPVADAPELETEEKE